MPSQQHVIRRGMTLDDIELVHHPHWLYNQFQVMWEIINENVPLKPEISMGCFLVVSRDTHALSMMDKGMMFI